MCVRYPGRRKSTFTASGTSLKVKASNLIECNQSLSEAIVQKGLQRSYGESGLDLWCAELISQWDPEELPEDTSTCLFQDQLHSHTTGTSEIPSYFFSSFEVLDSSNPHSSLSEAQSTDWIEGLSSGSVICERSSCTVKDVAEVAAHSSDESNALCVSLLHEYEVESFMPHSGSKTWQQSKGVNSFTTTFGSFFLSKVFSGQFQGVLDGGPSTANEKHHVDVKGSPCKRLKLSYVKKNVQLNKSKHLANIPHVMMEVAVRLEFGEAISYLLEKESTMCYHLPYRYLAKLRESEGCGESYSHNKFRLARGNTVSWMFKAVMHLQMSSLTAAHAVSFLDRFLSHSTEPTSKSSSLSQKDELLIDMRLSATACIWIAAKLDGDCTPDLSTLLHLTEETHDDDQILQMEIKVLRALGWRLLGATPSDFLVNMIGQLPAFGLPLHLLLPVGYRCEELIQGMLQEVEFLDYQPSVVSLGVMQCLLDECVPLHTTALMAAFHLALSIDLSAVTNCYSALVDLVVDPAHVCCHPSPDRVVTYSSTRCEGKLSTPTKLRNASKYRPKHS